jgi:hypothetical protein
MFEDLSSERLTLPEPGLEQDAAERLGDRWTAHATRLALGACHEQPRADPLPVEHLRPFEAVDLGTPEAGVERDRVGHGVLRCESFEQLRGLEREGDA